jgi:transcription antitermination protein NusB
MSASQVPRLQHRRRAARLSAIQALYAMEVAGAEGPPNLHDLLPKIVQPNGNASPQIDMDFLRGIVVGVFERSDELDPLLGRHLSSGWTPGRLEVLLRSILRAGAFELLAFPDVPEKVVINEYIDLAHDFFAGREPSLVNAVLDGIAGEVRTGKRKADNGAGPQAVG